jgi:hypothetical protein
MSGVGVGLAGLLLKGGANVNKRMSDHVSAIANVRATAVAGAFQLQNERENRQHVSDMTDKIHGYAADHTEVNYGNINYTRRPSETQAGEVVPSVEGGAQGSAPTTHSSMSNQFTAVHNTKSMEDSQKEAEMMIGGTRKEAPKPAPFADVQRSSAQFPSMPSESTPSEALTAAGKPGGGRKPAAKKAAPAEMAEPAAPKAARKAK